MFEAVVALCAGLSGEVCRDVLVPGFGADSHEICEAKRTRAAVNATCQPAGPTLETTMAGPGIFVHLGQVAEPDPQNRGDVANLGFVVGETGVAVIDTGAADWIGEALWRRIRAETDLPVTHVILTHMHPDHIFGTRVFQEAGAQIVGHAKLQRAILDRQQNYRVSLERLISLENFLGSAVPEITLPVTGQLKIDLGGRSIEVTAWPTAHSPADVTVLDRKTGTLFVGDLAFDKHTPALDGSLPGWQSVLGQLADAEVSQIVPGHGGPLLDWPSGYAGTQRYLKILAQDTRRMIDAGTRLGDAVKQIGAAEAPNWMLFDAYNTRNATVAFTELEWE